MSQENIIRNTIKRLEYNKEYRNDVFKNIDSLNLRKITKLLPELVGNTINGRYYKKLTKYNSKAPYEIPDTQAFDIYDPSEYTFNPMWQSSKPREIDILRIIAKVLDTVSEEDIFTLCKKYGKNRLRRILADKWKKRFKKGYISTAAIDIELKGRYDKNSVYKLMRKMIDESGIDLPLKWNWKVIDVDHFTITIIVGEGYRYSLVTDRQ